jgi:hypothetical protein
LKLGDSIAKNALTAVLIVDGRERLVKTVLTESGARVVNAGIDI